ncbi:DUF4395 domain-containing protein [Antrihabitans sp. YC2-6]|uniref:DUF4395 domain-containing protein n=1 Tax=Antrihabitans sp. YC2-6 TaxID=2799498 RepID=UPI0018F55339|nr:DUF4395 domain-containing protein [Antrihabitans sp. YC2-6]MBJ8344533.1 DUF4395 domain-containing protein [Antrihabitans sp. YC2-6]
MSTTSSTTSTGSSSTPAAAQTQVDVRGPRFVAWITTAVLVAVLITASFSLVAAAVLLAAQGVVFALGASRGPHRSPYGLLYSKVVLPRISAPTEKEPIAPLRFAQLVGFLFAVSGVVSFALGAGLVGTIFTGFALFAAFLNAAFGFCLGCQIYPLVAYFRNRSSQPSAA